MGWWKIVSEKSDFIESVYFPYSEKRKRQWQILIDSVDEYLNLKEGDSILELCCGTAALGVGLAEKRYNVTGLDKSPTMLGYAGLRAAKAGVDIHLVHREAQNIRELGKKFDAITMLDVTFGLVGNSKYDDVHLLESIYDSLKDGGRFLVEVVNPVYFKKYKISTIDGGFFKSEYKFNEKNHTLDLVTKVDGVDEVREGTCRMYHFELLEKVLTEGIGFRSAGVPDAADTSFVLSDRQTLYILCEK